MEAGVGPRIWKVLQKSQRESMHHIVDYFGDSSFEIRTPNVEQFAMDLTKNYCACRKWELSELPCSHAMAGILNRGLNILRLVCLLCH